MKCRIAIVSLCVATGLLVGCQRKEEVAEEPEPKSTESVPPPQNRPGGEAPPEDPANTIPEGEEAGGAGVIGGSPCANAACQEACSAYEGDELQKCAKAFVDGCFGPDRNAEECDPFGGAPKKRGSKEKKKGVGSKPPPAPNPEPDPGEPFGTKSDKDNGSPIDLQDNEENDGPVEKTPDKRLLDRPHPD